MLSRLCAAWLIAIIALPFTAPLATCDIADIMHGTLSRVPQAPKAPVPEAERSVSTTPVLATAPGRLRLKVLDTVVGVVSIGDIFVVSQPSEANFAFIRSLRSSRHQILRL